MLFAVCFQTAEGASSTLAKCQLDYLAVKEDEITVSKGETVQILATNQHNMFLVHRAANDTSPAAEGWLPGNILGHKEGDNGYR